MVLNDSTCDGLLLRPMSAKHLKSTIAETEGWVDREQLEAIHGRSRERQFELAEKYKLTDYESPGGGCLLTDENFAKKMHDFIKHDTFEVRDIQVIKYGRQLRLPDGAKLVVGRNQEDNEKIQVVENDKYVHIKTHGMTGPHSLLSRNASAADKELAARLVITYSKTEPDKTYELDFEGEIVSGVPLESKNDAQAYFVV